MANKNIFSSLLSTITAIGSLSIMASCGYDAYKNAKKSANADIYELNMQSQFNNPINANMLINNPYQQTAYLNSNKPTNLQDLGVKTKGWFKGAINSLSGNFITLFTAGLGAICHRNFLGKLFFMGSLASIFLKNTFKKSKNQNAQLSNIKLGDNQIPFAQMSNIPLIAPSNITVNSVQTTPAMPLYGVNQINAAYPYIPNNSPYIPYQQQMRLY